mgnify:CR=1 FL=1
MNEYINIGKLVAVFGLQGELILKHGLQKKLTFKKGDVIFLEMQKQSYLPYFVEGSKARTDDETLLLLEGVSTKEAAKLLVRKQVWLAEESFRKIAKANAPIALIGFMVVNEGAPLAQVEEVIEQPHQVLLRITYRDKEVLIPLHAETLDSIDKKKKEVHVTLPEGLLEIYL